MTSAAQPRAIHAFALLVVLAPFLRGGFPGWAVVALTAAATACLAWVRTEYPDIDPSSGGRDWPMTILGITVGYTALQALPVPCTVAAWLSPDAVEHARATGALLGPVPGLCAVSHDPGNTRTELLKGLAIAQVFVSARVLSRAGERKGVYYAVAASCLLMALVALVHWLRQPGASALYVAPAYGARRPLIAPLLNPNNLGGFTAMGVPLCLGLALEDARTERRPLWYVAAALMSFISLVSASRGAAAALLAGTLLLASLVLLRSRRRRPAERRAKRSDRGQAALIAAAVAAPMAVSLLAYLALDGLYDQLADADMSKLDFVWSAFEFSLHAPWLGVGRGAFAAAYRDLGGASRAFYAENFLVQWGSEWGWPIASALAATLAGALLGALPRARTAKIGAVASLVAFGCQNLVDLATELLGVTLVCAALFGVVTARNLRPSARDGGRARRARRARSGGFLLPGTALAALLLLGADAARYDYPGSIDRVRAQATGPKPADYVGAVAPVLRLHPAEPGLLLLAAAGVKRHAPEATGAWLGRVMALAPRWAEPHVQAATWLAGLGRADQAHLEVRAAAERDPVRAAQAFCAMTGRHADLAAIHRAAPAGPQRGRFLLRVSGCQGHNRALLDALNDELVRDFPSYPSPLEHTFHRALRAGELDRASELAARFQRLLPDHPRGPQMVATALAAGGRRGEAIALLERAAARRTTQSPELLGLLARLYGDAGRDSEARSALGKVLRNARGGAAKASAHLLLAQLEQRLGNQGQALTAYQRAASIDERADTLRPLAHAALAQGRHAVAYRAVSRLCELTPQDAWACEQRKRLRAKPKF